MSKRALFRMVVFILLIVFALPMVLDVYTLAKDNENRLLLDEMTFGYDQNQVVYSVPNTSEDVVNSNEALTDTAKFVIGTGTDEYSLEEALSSISSSATTITLTTSGTLYGSYTIPSNVTLLIPFNDDHDCIKEMSESFLVGNSTAAGTGYYRKLTLANGASLTVNGTISVSSKLSAAQGYLGAPTGKYGQIQLDEGSSIVLSNKANLYAWGYITGSGVISAKNGSSVYEVFQIADFRGGKATLAMVEGLYGCSNVDESSVFPFSQYYVQNIEAYLRLEYGAKEYCFADIYMNSDHYTSTASFVGTSASMFIQSQGSVITKYYDGKTDRLHIYVEGNVSIGHISVKIESATVDTKDYYLPINGNITIVIKEGGNCSADYNLNLLPGTEVYIETGATLTVSNGISVYLYDYSEWDGYCDSNNSQLQPVSYSPTKTKTRTASDLKDAAVYVNGTISLNGKLYTTASGADVTGRNYPGIGDSGSVVFVAAAPTAASTTKQAKYSASSPGYIETSITANSVWLHNSDASSSEYVKTVSSAAGTEFGWDPVSNTWIKNPVTITYNNNFGDELITVQKIVSGVETAIGQSMLYTGSPYYALTREGYMFDGWNTKADGTGIGYINGQVVSLSSDLTLYAQWKEVTYTVTWKNVDGTVLEIDENVEEGATPEYNGSTPVRAPDRTYIYVFSGWDPVVAEVTGDVTYTAVYEKVEFRFTAASLYLESNTSIKFKVSEAIINAESGFTDVYAKFTFHDTEYTVEGELDEEEGKYIFIFDDIQPHFYDDTVYATLYGKYEGTEYASYTVEYSVSKYCYNMLTGTDAQNNSAFKTMLVDLLNYGAAAQEYQEYNVEALVNRNLTKEQAACGTQTDPALTDVKNVSSEMADPEVSWTAAALVLDNSVVLKVNFTAENIEGVVIKAQVGSKVTEITSADFKTEGSEYFIYFDKFLACEMSKAITLTAYDAGGNKISNVLTYSIESYAFSKIKPDANAKLVAILKAMMKYGYAAKAYEESK